MARSRWRCSGARPNPARPSRSWTRTSRRPSWSFPSMPEGSLGGEAPILGGELTAEAGAEERDPPSPAYDARADDYAEPVPADNQERDGEGPVGDQPLDLLP